MGQGKSSASTSTGPAPISKDAKIVIVGGGGTIGSSTALHLVRRGYTDVRILDVYQSPSANSAGNDINKIAGSDGTGIWGDLSVDAWDMWMNDPVFRDHGHRVGKLDMSSKATEQEALRQEYDEIQRAGRGHTVSWLETEEDILAVAPHLRIATITGWKGMYVREGGWVAARDALDSVAVECNRLGVKTAFGTSGTFKSLILSDGGVCRGVEAIDGTRWDADLVVFAAGAWSPALIDLQGQCESKCWVYAHIQLSDKEKEDIKGIPTVYQSELGFFMEPRDNGLLKLCNEFPGYTNLTTCRPFGATSDQLMSVPRSHADHPTDTMPTESLDDIKRLVSTCLPHLVDRPLINQAMCWCTDTPDARWLLCRDPRWANLILATGDSGHTFKMLPIVGREVVDLIENKLPAEKMEMWKWRPRRGDPEGTGRGGPRPKDLQALSGWRHDEA